MNTHIEMAKNVETGIEKNNYSCRYLEGCEAVRLSLMVDATNSCQLNCRYCYYGKKGKKFMDVNKVFRTCSNMASVFSTKPKEINIHYMGGEPLLAWDKILDLNEMAKTHFGKLGIPFNWSMTSNLVALDAKKADHMIKEKASIHCSIDGPADIHNHNRPFKNGKGSFAHVAKAIPLALSITPDDTARVTVCSDDAERMTEITQEVLDRGFQTVGLFPASGDSWTPERIEKWQRGIVDSFKLVQKVYGEEKSVSTIIKPILRRAKQVQQFSYCGAGKGLWGVSVDGGLFFCHHMTNRPELAIINAASASIEEIRAAIESSILPPRTADIYTECQSCSALEFCNGGCWSNSFLSNGSAITPVNSDCTLKIATVEAVGKIMYIDPNNCQDKNYQFGSDCYINCKSSCESSDRKSCCHSCDRCYLNECSNACQSKCERRCDYCDECQGCDGRCQFNQ